MDIKSKINVLAPLEEVDGHDLESIYIFLYFNIQVIVTQKINKSIFEF